MSFIWGNSTKSGLCDRLIDLFIIASLSKLFNKELYLLWEEQPNNDLQKLIWNNIRFDDYKIENVIQYFNFPSIIHFISKEELENKINNKSEEDILYNIYLGGIYSPFTFYDKFINKKYNKNNYINIFKNLINQFKPTKKLLNLIKNIPKNLISVHLRRTDKSSKLISAEESQGIDINDMDELNNKTMELINKFILYNNYYFSSDCIDTKKYYENIYSNHNIINYDINIPYEQTYVDIYLMSKSKYIILSQRHSSFSLFCSLINNAKLIYFYEDSILHNNLYYNFNNIIKYEKIGILYFHQGWADIMNCLSLINYYSNIYDKIYLIIRNDSKLLIDYYTSNIFNIIILYEDKNNLNIQNNAIEYTINKYNLPLYSDFLSIGYHDISRKDIYKNKFKYIDNCFVKGFYESYDIPYIIRINNFIFNRNYELEEETYNNFIELYGNKYILYHEVIENYDQNIKIINLDKLSNIFFDFIKIIENAIEIHLLDSTWAVFIYLLDCKYQLFNNKKIFLYNKRGYRKMFEDPVKLPNWKFC